MGGGEPPSEPPPTSQPAEKRWTISADDFGDSYSAHRLTNRSAPYAWERITAGGVRVSIGGRDLPFTSTSAKPVFAADLSGAEQTPVQRGFLGHHADEALDLVRPSYRIDTKHPYRARSGAQFGGNLADQRSLAGAIRANDTQNLTPYRGKGDAIVGPGAVPVALPDVDHLNRLVRWHRGSA